MDIRNIPRIKRVADARLENAPHANKIVLIYTGIVIGLSLLVTVICYCLNLQIDQFGGLSNMGKKSILSTLETALPIISNLAIMCLELGFTAAMLRICRGQYTSPQTLRAGMPRFWAMIRCSLILSLRYVIATFASAYLATFIFGLTPMSNAAMEILTPMMEGLNVMDASIVLDDATLLLLMKASIPLFVLWGIFFAALAIPMAYNYRMAHYILLDKPQVGATIAMLESKHMMRKNRFALFKVDLSVWWYHALVMLANAVCYGDMVFAILGIELPFSGDAGYFLFYGMHIILIFGIYYYFRNKVGVIYALAYDSLKPKEEASSGVVLGNIFQMQEDEK